MASYRVYWIGPNGRLSQGDPIACANDAEAIATFRAMTRGREAAELWDGGRLVARHPQQDD